MWRSVLAPPVHTPLPAMSAAEVRQHLGRGVLSDARPADSALFGRDVQFDLEGLKELGPEDASAADYFKSIDCSCNDGSAKVGDACGQGEEVSAVGKFGFIGSAGPPGYPRSASVTCRDGNRCECNETRLQAGIRTCDDHEYGHLDEDYTCEFNGTNCTHYVHSSDGDWVADEQTVYPLCEADGSETTMVHFAGSCWRPKVGLGSAKAGLGEAVEKVLKQGAKQLPGSGGCIKNNAQESIYVVSCVDGTKGEQWNLVPSGRDACDGLFGGTAFVDWDYARVQQPDGTEKWYKVSDCGRMVVSGEPG